MTNIPLTPDEEQQLDQLQKDLGTPAAAATTEATPTQDICEYWAKYKRYWPILIQIVKRIPKYGAALARLLEKVGQLLDTYCGAIGLKDFGLSQDDEQKLEKLQGEFGEASAATAEAVSIQDICEYWQRYKEYWPILIKIVRRIPKYGEPIARLLEKIGQLLDAYCAQKK